MLAIGAHCARLFPPGLNQSSGAMQYTQYQELQVARTPSGTPAAGPATSALPGMLPASRQSSFSGPSSSPSPDRSPGPRQSGTAPAGGGSMQLADSSLTASAQLSRHPSHALQIQRPHSTTSHAPLLPLVSPKVESPTRQSSASAAGVALLMDSRASSFTRKLAPLVRAFHVAVCFCCEYAMRIWPVHHMQTAEHHKRFCAQSSV